MAPTKRRPQPCGGCGASESVSAGGFDFLRDKPPLKEHNPARPTAKTLEGNTMTVIPLSDIQDDGTTRMRVAGIDPSVVADNADAMEAGAVFPPIIVYHDGEQYWPGDGFHRIDAARRIGRETINADIREGGRRDALLLAASANATHGLRRTQADKRKSVETLLRDLEWSRWSRRGCRTRPSGRR